MKLGGCQKLTLLDFPGHTACTVFTEGCNFRCPFCHNSSLVVMKEKLPEYDINEFFSFLEKRHGLLDGVAITGGEPLLQPDIIDFIRQIRNLGFDVKLDTNGSIPSVLEEIIQKQLVNYIAMDIKNCKENYAKTCGLTSFDLGKIEKSIQLIYSSGIPFEFRTTVVKELHTKDDLIKIAQWIPSDSPYFLQGFVDSGDILEANMSAYSNDEMRELLTAIKPFNSHASLRGIND